MNQVIGSLLVLIGSIWITISTCGIVVMMFALWIIGLLWMISWGGIIGCFLWLLFGTGIVALFLGIAATPISLLGAGMVTIGEAMKNSDRDKFDALQSNNCRECGRARVQSDDEFCRSCGHPYG